MKQKYSIFLTCVSLVVLMQLFACTKSEVEDTPEDTTYTVFDIDGNGYHSLVIGEQEWMVENLKVTRYNDGTAIPYVEGDSKWDELESPAYCWYNNDETAHKEKYGALYNWYAVNTGKLAPKGWHVPSDEEWTQLEDYLIAKGYNYDYTLTENKLAKSLAAATGWRSYNVEGTPGSTDYPYFQNLSGFSAVPAGHRGYEGKFNGLGETTTWWSSSIAYDSPNDQVHLFNAYYRMIYYQYRDVWRRYGSKYMGFSVRCIRDLPDATGSE